MFEKDKKTLTCMLLFMMLVSISEINDIFRCIKFLEYMPNLTTSKRKYV